MNSILISVVSILAFFRILRSRAAARSRDSLPVRPQPVTHFTSFESSLNSRDVLYRESSGLTLGLTSPLADGAMERSGIGCEREKGRLAAGLSGDCWGYSEAKEKDWESDWYGGLLK